jgi:hypothetical protein
VDRVVGKILITPAGSEIRGKRPYFAQKSKGSTDQWTDARNSTKPVTVSYLRGVLVAISIPIFTAQLEKSRDAVTVANVRSAYAEAQAAYLTGDSDAANHVTVTKDANGVVTSVEVSNVESKGTQSGGVSDADLPFDASDLTALDNTPSDNNTLVFTYDANGGVTVALKQG